MVTKLADSGGGRFAAVGARQPGFFAAMSALLLVIVFFGFAPTYYLKPTTEPALPAYLHVHGALLTIWFLLLLFQSGLVATHRRTLHMRLGLGGAALAVLIVLSGLLVVVRSVPNGLVSGQPMEIISLIVVGDLLVLAIFAIMLVVAVRYRREPAIHARLMLLASILISSPALGRASLHALGTPIPGLLVQMSLPFALVAHDRLVSRRIHRATIWGTAAILGSFAVSVAIANTTFGQNFVRSLQ